ncbi:MAG: hypothetical protein Q9163_004311 [Psora crenata]
MDAYTKADTVSIYLSMSRGEVSTSAIVKDALSKGKQVYVPYLQNESWLQENSQPKGVPRKYMEMVSLHSEEDYCRAEVNKDKWGIPSVEPESLGQRIKIPDWKNSMSGYDVNGNGDEDGESSRHLRMQKENAQQQQPRLDTIIMPGLAFDRGCRRLGHGKGYYDTFLKKYHDIKIAKSKDARMMPKLIGLALNEQVLPQEQEIPIIEHDWLLDALLVGDGSVIPTKMVTTATAGFGPVLSALSMMQSNAEREEKSQAHEYLEKFQKSVCDHHDGLYMWTSTHCLIQPEAWTTTHSILSSQGLAAEAKLFAATTLKGKITYDLDQLPRQSLSSLRDSLLTLLTSFQSGPRPIRTQLCVCLANLAIQMTEWKDVIQLVGSTLGNSGLDCTLEFLKVLPEEVTEGRRINLTEEDLVDRTKELLEDNAKNVLELLIRYSQSSVSASSNTQLLECISSWLREIPVADVVTSPLFDAVVNALAVDNSFEAAVDCMCTILRDTREVDESIEIIQLIYPRLVSLKPKIAQAAESNDQDTYKGYTRLFAEAGEHWAVLIARLPHEFGGLVAAILECCARDTDREAISLTFLFWYEFKQMIVLDKYREARAIFAGAFAKLVDVMIKHLQFPGDEGTDEADLFDGDLEQEEKFREFRHQMGDVLKDCCEVISVTECLGKAFALIQQWIATYGSQATSNNVPHWQELEASLFGMRAMGRMVAPDENIVLPQVIPLMVQIPNHEKLRFQAIMALGRYTEWTSQHPEFLQPQLNFVMAGFKHESREVVKAAALAFRFFGTDCRRLLADHVTQLHEFYESILDSLPNISQGEVTEGVACVVSAQPLNEIYPTFKLYCDPIIQRMMTRADKAKSGKDEPAQLAVADYLQLLTIFIQHVQPHVPPSEENPAITYCQEILPVMSAIAENFTACVPILERVCRCWRSMVLSYRTAILPLLPTLAQQLATGFVNSRQGCFLWATDSVLREFANGAEFVDANTSQHIYDFFEQQALAFLRIMNDLPPGDLPDVIEDFFRLLIDALIYYHTNLLHAPICSPILSAAISALTLEQEPPLTAALHFLRDFLSYGTAHPNFSTFDDDELGVPRLNNDSQAQASVKNLLIEHGEVLTQRIMTGMMFSFPRDCFPDASGVLLALFEIMPEQSAMWVKGTISMLPAGTVKQGEAERLMRGIGQKLQEGELRKVRVLLQDFTNGYRRKNVAPREGLGRLEATRFRFSG